VFLIVHDVVVVSLSTVFDEFFLEDHKCGNVCRTVKKSTEQRERVQF
jgi:hypothetical protein